MLTFRRHILRLSPDTGSTCSINDAVRRGIERAEKTLRNIKGAWVKEQHVAVEGGTLKHFRVNMMVTFVLED